MASMSTPTDDLATLNHQIAQLETDVARLEIERRGAAKTVARLTRRDRYLRLARWFRAPAASVAGYTLAVFAIGPLAAGVVIMVLVNLVLSSWTLALVGLLVGAIAGGAMCAALLYLPSDSLLAAELPEIGASRRVGQVRLEDVLRQLTTVSDRLQSLLKERRQLATTGKLQRAMLLQRDWKQMHGTEWEDFVVETCRTLGANVQRVEHTGREALRPGTPPTGPRGAIPRIEHTLVVTFSPRRIAVAAVTGVRPFHTAAVQQFINELAQHGCDRSAIITNCRLTSGGKELAAARRSTLIGEEEFPDFVMGKITL